MKLVSVTRKGQVTIPEDVRKQLGIKIGSKLLVEGVNKELVIMKRIELMKSLETLQRIGQRLAKKRGISMKDVEKGIKKVRTEIWKEKI